MPADLPSDEFFKTATVMLRLHADFRARHHLAPLPIASTLFENLESLKGRSRLNHPDILRSPRPVIGGVIAATRRILWKILKPVFDRQTEVNLDQIMAIEILTLEAVMSDRQARQALSARVAELEAKLARPHERVE